MNWVYLIIAGIFEVGFTSCLGKAKQSAGTEAVYWYAGFALCMVLSFTLLMKAIETLPLGTAYAVWTGIGAAGSVIVGIVLFNDPVSVWRLFFVSTLIGSIIGLKLIS